MQKWIMFTLVSIASVMAVLLLAFGLPDKPVDEESLLPEGVTLMKVIASNDFTFNESEFKAVAGEELLIKYSNKSGLHAADVVDAAGNIIFSLDDKENAELSYTFTEPGEYEIICNIPCGPGHATMKAKLVVTAA